MKVDCDTQPLGGISNNKVIKDIKVITENPSILLFTKGVFDLKP